MRHQNKKGRLNRRSAWRKATLKAMANDLFTYQRIETTQTKAKALRSFAEPLITIAKKNPDSVAARRQVRSKLCDETVVKILFTELAPLFKDIPGGYTRIMSLGNRKGDGAKVAIIELTKRTISDDDLLGKTKEKEAKKKLAKKKGKKTEDETKGKKEDHAAPELKSEDKEERSVEDIKKTKARNEQKKVDEKGIFKRFRRRKTG
jgi:large subunit ribosomal protein L17